MASHAHHTRGVRYAMLVSIQRVLAPPALLPSAGGRGMLAAARAAVGSRRRRPWLAMVGLPLATTAALLAGQWWAVVPLAVCAWWFAPGDWEWNWLVAILTGVVGLEWAVVGTTALAAWPNRRAVGVAWACAAALLALVATCLHRRATRR